MSDLDGKPDDVGDLYSDDVSRAYRAVAREQPSAELDHVIHMAALRGARARPRTLTAALRRRWSVPIAIAATIVVGASVAFLAADRPDSPIAPAGKAPVPQLRDADRPVQAPEAPRSSLETGEVDKLREAQPSSEAVAKQAPPTAVMREARPTRERTTRDEFVANRGQPAPQPAQSVPRPESSATPDVPVEAKGLRNVPPGAELQTDQGAESLSPEVWLQRIREFRSRGELTQAEASLRAFRRRYPDYPLPADVPASTDLGK
jgi:hypothetical protein